jgi:Scaffold protein Nfu/NifU N terminal/HEAT repeats
LYRRPVANRHAKNGPGPELDAARALVVGRGLTATAVAALTETVTRLPLEALTPVKQLLKRFFSDQPWTEHDDDALAVIVGSGSGSETLTLAPDLTLTWGWHDGRFRLRVDGPVAIAATARVTATAAPGSDLGPTFESDVVPEVTPSPRTIRFGTPPLHTGTSRFYNSADEAAEDPRAARVFRDFDAVTNVLVGPDFIAVTISRPDQWETLLAPILRTIAEELTGVAPSGAPESLSPEDADAERTGAHSDAEATRSPRRLERAWSELGALRADRPDDLERILTASRDPEPAHRQVAAALFTDAPAVVATDAWDRLLSDDSRSVRRSVIDAVVDAHREALRPLLERALTDPDAWTRWKAVHGIAALGVTSSRAAVEACTTDPDFRVRLEAAHALG